VCCCLVLPASYEAVTDLVTGLPDTFSEPEVAAQLSVTVGAVHSVCGSSANSGDLARDDALEKLRVVNIHLGRSVDLVEELLAFAAGGTVGAKTGGPSAVHGNRVEAKHLTKARVLA